jgi:hypothetical protein
MTHLAPPTVDADRAAFYVTALTTLREAAVPFLVGGAYALQRYTGIVRDTKDLDVFVRARDCAPALRALAAAGFPTELTFPHWLGKATWGDAVLDVIFSSGNGCAPVDDDWFLHAVDSEVMGVPVQLCPAEETIWSKAFIMERERYDGADVAHLLHARGPDLDWHRLLRRFRRHWRVLLSHLVLFGFIYPGERHRVPEWVLHELLARWQRQSEAPPSSERLCGGTLLSRSQYLTDVHSWGYDDARLVPRGTMSAEDVRTWTDAALSDR